MRIFLIGITAFFLGCAGSPAGNQIDDWCVAGKLGEKAAYYLNKHKTQWNQHDDYQKELKAGDRIVNADCSEYLINLANWDFVAAYESYKRIIKADDSKPETKKKFTPGLKRRRR